jgi:hypothetical protein
MYVPGSQVTDYELRDIHVAGYEKVKPNVKWYSK